MTPEHAVEVQVMDDGWRRLKLTAELLEDAHPGSGSGGAGIDALFARDRYGRPVIWASHLEGVLRDAARRLWNEAEVNAVFGKAGGDRQPALFTSLYVTSTPNSSNDQTSRIWRSSARATYDNRAPAGDMLRAVEHVPKGTCFEGSVELPVGDLARLRRLLKEVDYLGQGRATGAGRVKLDAAPAEPETRDIGEATGRLVLRLRNLDPLCITATATPDNILPSLGYVPARALIGALANWLLARGRGDAATWLVDGALSVSDALPTPSDLSEAKWAEVEIIPAPLWLRREKPTANAGDIPWWAQPHVSPTRVKCLDPALPRSEEALFLCRADPDACWTAFRPTMRVRLRNGRSDPNAPEPSLFAVEQIVERTEFLCEIRGAPENLTELTVALAPVLEGRRWLRLGRGGAPVGVMGPPAWAGDRTPEGGALLTLTSDLLVRDEDLRWLTRLDARRFPLVAGWPDDVAVTPVVQDTVAVHGFNGTSRLWRMPAAAIRRGSVFKVGGAGVDTLAAMAASGQWLGERTHEGFGRFRLDDDLPGVTGPGVPGNVTEAPTLHPLADDPDDAIAKTTCDWFEKYRAPVSDADPVRRRPSRSQWRDLLSELGSDRETQVSDALPSRMDPKSAGKETWRHSRAKAVLDRLDALGTNADRVSHVRLFIRWLEADQREDRS